MIWRRFDPVAIDYLNSIHDRFKNVEVVITSTWRKHDGFKSKYVPGWVEAAFRSAGFRGWFADLWRTNDLHYSVGRESRAFQIQDWLNLHDDIRDFIILDDDDCGFTEHFPKNFVKTDCADGLLFRHILASEEILKSWEAK